MSARKKYIDMRTFVCYNVVKLKDGDDVLINKAYKFRLYPNQKQKELINKTFGCTRLVYNYYLDKKIKEFETNKHSLS